MQVVYDTSDAQSSVSGHKQYTGTLQRCNNPLRSLAKCDRNRTLSLQKIRLAKVPWLLCRNT